MNGTVHWERVKAIPAGAAAVLSALSLQSSVENSPFRDLSGADWGRTLSFCDHAQLTLLLGSVCRQSLPAPVLARIDADQKRSAQRSGRFELELLAIANRLRVRGIDFVLLKGFAHGLDWAPERGVRPQYDLDFFVPKQELQAAREEILALGYETVSGRSGSPTDHLPIMVRKTGWRWRGDFYDPAIPPTVDLHFRLWDESMERLAAPGVDAFWNRRLRRSICGAEIPVLCPADDIGYCALHAVRHLFRGDLRVFHIFEIAYFLHGQAENLSLWDSWHSSHPPELRRVEALAFELARRWFDCHLAPPVEREVAQLGHNVDQWMNEFAASPITGMFRPDKSELWLHLSLLKCARDRLSIARRRLFPLNAPGVNEDVFIPDDQLTLIPWLRSRVRYFFFAAARAAHHCRALMPALGQGLKWAIRHSRSPASAARAGVIE